MLSKEQYGLLAELYGRLSASRVINTNRYGQDYINITNEEISLMLKLINNIIRIDKAQSSNG